MCECNCVRTNLIYNTVVSRVCKVDGVNGERGVSEVGCGVVSVVLCDGFVICVCDG